MAIINEEVQGVKKNCLIISLRVWAAEACVSCLLSSQRNAAWKESTRADQARA